MRLVPALLLATLVAAAAPAPAVAQDAPAAGSWDGLVEVNANRLDAAFLLPGADFSGFTRVMLDEPEVAFRQNWMRDVNRSRSTGRRVTEADAARIQQTVSASSIDIFSRAFTDAGFEVVTRPGPDVARVRIGIMNLFVNAPDTMSAGRTTSFVTNAGEATLVLEVRDSQTNALLARVVDRREARRNPGPANQITNAAEFRALAGTWARISATGLTNLKQLSPVPDPLVAGQRLP